jgi:hypothetical protein
MSFIKKSASAFGKLFVVVALAAAFLAGMVGVVYMSLQGEEMKVPEIVGKDFAETEKEFAALGLKIKKRADRYSTEKPNTILEQLPKSGDTVKTGQMILVVTSKTNPEGEEAPVTLKKNGENDQDDSEKIEELISDKPKKSNKINQNQSANSNKKKGSTTRDVIKEKTSGSSNSNSSADNSNKSNSNPGGNSSTGNSNKTTSTNSNGKVTNQANTSKTNSNKPSTSGGDTRPRKTPQP